jgi:hypothetical protein
VWELETTRTREAFVRFPKKNQKIYNNNGSPKQKSTSLSIWKLLPEPSFLTDKTD